MAEDNHHPPSFFTLAGRLARTSLGALQNRAELLTVEWQEERARLAELLVWSVGFLFFAILGILLLTATIIFLFREDLRIYVAGGFAALYLIGAFVTWLSLRSLLRQEPFAETLDQVRKDRVWLDSSK